MLDPEYVCGTVSTSRTFEIAHFLASWLTLTCNFSHPYLSRDHKFEHHYGMPSGEIKCTDAADNRKKNPSSNPAKNTMSFNIDITLLL